MPRAKGERRLEILKALAHMLEAPKWERITTAALAEKLDVSEAALYRHFASKAQMYEGLIEFIESSVFTLANRIAEDESDGRRQADKLVEMLLAFAEKNPGMVRVMTGDALVGEHERLQAPVRQERLREEARREFQRPAPLPALIRDRPRFQAGWNGSIGLPSGSSSWICFPPGPDSISLRKLKPCCFIAATRAGQIHHPRPVG